jgi:DNA modification methylase
MVKKPSKKDRDSLIKILKGGKKIPSKYRYLFYKDEDVAKEYELVYAGKARKEDIIADTLAAPLQEVRTFNSDNKFDDGWTNKLIFGDNLMALKNLYEDSNIKGKVKLIYIDPPFDVGADFSMDIEIGQGDKTDTFTKRPSIMEEIAYRDTWGKGADSFISMIYERLVLMRDLLAEDGSIYVHCDWRVNSLLKLVMNEVFGNNFFRNEIIWTYRKFARSTTQFPQSHDTIFFYTKSKNNIFNKQFVPLAESTMKRWKGKKRGGKDPNNRYATDEDSPGAAMPDVWDIPLTIGANPQNTGYPTQKPMELIQRIVEASSNAGDLIADFFCGSGTLAVIAEGLRTRKVEEKSGSAKQEFYFAEGRKWICTDLSKFAIHTTRKRMISVQRSLKADGKHYRAFEILNLGKYERQHYIGINPNLREVEQQQQLAEKEKVFLELILKAYRAEKIDGFATFHGKKAGRMVSIGPVNLPVARLFVEEVILECRKKHITRVDILGFEFEMGLFPNVLDEARAKGIDISPKYIPAEVFDKRAVEKNQVVFHDVAFIEVKPHVKKNTAAMELTDFSVFYSQDSIASAEATLRNKKSKIVVEKGQIIKVSKDKDGIVRRETLTRKWTDWIDYWAVDFDFESKKEIIRVNRSNKGAQIKIDGSTEPTQLTLDDYEEIWTGDFIFENEWQSFRTKKNRTLELKSVFHECVPGRRKIAVKVVDIFGNDTMTIVDLNIGGKN